jgi:hypothetical protein
MWIGLSFYPRPVLALGPRAPSRGRWEFPSIEELDGLLTLSLSVSQPDKIPMSCGNDPRVGR